MNLAEIMNRRPKRIILVRHGQSTSNSDVNARKTTPDHKIPLTPHGSDQARKAGVNLVDVISDHGKSNNWNAYFYVSPFQRTRSTLEEILRAFPGDRVLGVREDPSLREQSRGNLLEDDNTEELLKAREIRGGFFYQHPAGESGADVYGRVSGFVEALWRDIEMKRLSDDPCDEVNIVIVLHGLSTLAFLMKWFNWTPEQYESMKWSMENGELRVLELGSPGGEYSLAIQHDDETLDKWGLSPDMIDDQHRRAQAECGDQYIWKENINPWSMKSFLKLPDGENK